jgi:hypothetical protein
MVQQTRLRCRGTRAGRDVSVLRARCQAKSTRQLRILEWRRRADAAGVVAVTVVVGGYRARPESFLRGLWAAYAALRSPAAADGWSPPFRPGMRPGILALISSGINAVRSPVMTIPRIFVKPTSNTPNGSTLSCMRNPIAQNNPASTQEDNHARTSEPREGAPLPTNHRRAFPRMVHTESTII